MTKSIDWTRPLRVVGTHERIDFVETRWDAGTARHRVYWHGGQMLTGNDGVPWPSKEDPLSQRAVENIPPEPRIVERWGYICKIGHDCYTVPTQFVRESKDAPVPFGTRRVKFIIEEPGE